MNRRIGRRQFLGAAALTPLAVSAGLSASAEETEPASSLNRFFFVSQGKTAMMSADGSGLHVFEFDVAAGTYYPDDEFRWSAAKRTVALSTSNQIGRCFKETLASATKVLLKINAYVAY